MPRWAFNSLTLRAGRSPRRSDMNTYPMPVWPRRTRASIPCSSPWGSTGFIDAWNLFLCHKFSQTLRLGPFMIMKHAQRWKRVQEFVRSQQKHRITRPADETLLLCSVGFVDQQAARLERRNQGREELVL